MTNLHVGVLLRQSGRTAVNRIWPSCRAEDRFGTAPAGSDRCPEEDLELNPSVHHWGKGNRSLSPEDGVGSAIEVVE
jgi:hypothetical protein